jgi:hypothetical protein
VRTRVLQLGDSSGAHMVCTGANEKWIRNNQTRLDSILAVPDASTRCAANSHDRSREHVTGRFVFPLRAFLDGYRFVLGPGGDRLRVPHLA